MNQLHEQLIAVNSRISYLKTLDFGGKTESCNGINFHYTPILKIVIIIIVLIEEKTWNCEAK
jgi:hypothetical protein